MKIALIQSPLVWEDIQTNINYFGSVIDNLEKDVDLIILPEMFTTGFTMRPENSFDVNSGYALQWMQNICINNNTALTGSIIIKENDEYFNRLYFVFPDGKYETYDKRHLFSLAGEEKKYSAGKNRLIVTYKDWRICPLVCYDLRFPVFSRNIDEAYDLLIYVANWPDKRIYAWDTLLKARAIENMCYTIGVNRVGTDYANNTYSGHSQLVDYLGRYLISPQFEEAVFYAELDKNSLMETRNKLAFLKDADNFNITD